MSTFSNPRQLATVQGNPTPEENAVLATVIASTRADSAPARKRQSEKQGDSSDHDPDVGPQDTPMGKLEEHRKCPICQRRFDSKFALTEQRRITASKDSTLCFDIEYDRAYLHTVE